MQGVAETVLNRQSDLTWKTMNATWMKTTYSTGTLALSKLDITRVGESSQQHFAIGKEAHLIQINQR